MALTAQKQLAYVNSCFAVCLAISVTTEACFLLTLSGIGERM